MEMVVDQVMDKKVDEETNKVAHEVIKDVIQEGINELMGKMVLVKVEVVAMEVVVVMKMVLMEVDHAMNVEGNREAAKLANWFTKRSVMTSSVTSLSTLLASFSTTLSINWSITIPNTTSPHLRCHKNSQAIWRSSVGLPGSPVVFTVHVTKERFFRDTL